jgi:hypothetical protein
MDKKELLKGIKIKAVPVNLNNLKENKIFALKDQIKKANNYFKENNIYNKD